MSRLRYEQIVGVSHISHAHNDVLSEVVDYRDIADKPQLVSVKDFPIAGTSGMINQAAHNLVSPMFIQASRGGSIIHIYLRIDDNGDIFWESKNNIENGKITVIGNTGEISEQPEVSYFYISDVSGMSNTVTIQKTSPDAPTLNIEYSTNGTTWTARTMNADTTENTFIIPAHGKLYLRGVNERWAYGNDRCNIINANGEHYVGGNVMSLLYGENYEGKTTFPTVKDFTLAHLFNSDINLINAKMLVLPATKMYNNSYNSMFYGCTNLVAAPSALPATDIAINCYSNMFYGCVSLVDVFDELPALVLAKQCYQYMFYGCLSLVNMVKLPATELAEYCYANMYNGCSSLVNVQPLMATILKDYCYYNMFSRCIGMLETPIIGAQVLAPNCCTNMFHGCSSLVSTSDLLAQELAPSCYQSMYANCQSLINATTTLPATQLVSKCYYNMFNGCASLQRAPELMAIIFAPNCCQYMYQGCRKLNYVKVHFTDYSNTNNEFTNWMYSVSQTGTFEIGPTNFDPESIRGVSGIPNNWNIIRA